MRNTIIKPNNNVQISHTPQETKR